MRSGGRWSAPLEPNPVNVIVRKGKPWDDPTVRALIRNSIPFIVEKSVAHSAEILFEADLPNLHVRWNGWDESIVQFVVEQYPTI